MTLSMLGGEVIEGTAKIVNEAIKDSLQVYLIINNCAGGNAPLLAKQSPPAFIQRSRRGSFEPLN
jgi:hypothetical protein